MRSNRRPVDLEWLQQGDHLCLFFDGADDLFEVLVPYFKAGLEREDSCLWVTDDSNGSGRASDEMRAALPDFERRAAAGQIEIVTQDEWLAGHKGLSAHDTIRYWLSRKDAAMASGYSGLRIAGHLSSMQEKDPAAFLAYEQAVDEAFKAKPIVALCNYCMRRWTGKGILDAVERHAFGLAKLRGRWMPVEAWPRDPGARSGVRARTAARSRRQTDVAQLIEGHLAAHMLAYPERIALDGPRVVLRAFPAERLRLALGELAANALTYGALAGAQGGLAIAWRVVANGSRRLRLTWAEHGMSGLVVPEWPGQGTYRIAASVENCMRTFEPGGMRCTFDLAL
jgi:hypothetical protein